MFINKMATLVRSKNQNYNLQFIRDLYDKMFPNAKDYIKFLQEEINQCHYEKSNLFFDKMLKLTKKEKKYCFPFINGASPYDQINAYARDYWEGLEKKEILFFKLLTRKWLKTKSKKQRRIWNYYVLGVPKEKIAPKLEENRIFVMATIKILQKEYFSRILIKKIPN